MERAGQIQNTRRFHLKSDLGVHLHYGMRGEMLSVVPDADRVSLAVEKKNNTEKRQEKKKKKTKLVRVRGGMTERRRKNERQQRSFARTQDFRYSSPPLQTQR